MVQAGACHGAIPQVDYSSLCHETPLTSPPGSQRQRRSFPPGYPAGLALFVVSAKGAWVTFRNLVKILGRKDAQVRGGAV
jgi:hypothetical protein